MKKNTVVELSSRDKFSDALSELLRNGAGKLVQQATEVELSKFMEQFEKRVLDDGRAAVVRNGFQPERDIQTGIGPVRVRIPKIRAKDGKPVAFHSALATLIFDQTQSLEAGLPWLYLKGIFSREMQNILEVLVGPEAKGLSASTVCRLKQQESAEYKEWCGRRLEQHEWAYIWVDGIYSGLRVEEIKLCALVIVGVNARREKHFLAIEDGMRESTQSWREVLLDLKARGFKTPKLAIGDGAMGFWAALDEMFPTSRQQRCWMHKSSNILNAIPKSMQPKIKQALQDIGQAEDKESAEEAFNLFVEKFELKYPKAAVCLQKDHDELLGFYEFPAQHWHSIRTTNPIESTFATIRHRTKRLKGCLNRDGMLHMIFKLGQCAQKNWRRQRGFNALAKVITGVKFEDGIEVTESNRNAA